MRVHRFRDLALIMTVCCLASCGEKRLGPKINKVPVVPVSGTVKVDGKPEAGVVIRCVPLGEFKNTDIINSMGGQTDTLGEFTLHTYEIDDGVPPGEYALLFAWPTVTLKKGGRADEDKNDRLKKKYSKLDQPFLKIKVEPDTPKTLEEVQLSTK